MVSAPWSAGVVDGGVFTPKSGVDELGNDPPTFSVAPAPAGGARALNLAAILAAAFALSAKLLGIWACACWLGGGGGGTFMGGAKGL